MSVIRLATSCRRFAFLPFSSTLRFSTNSARILTGPLQRSLQRSFSVNHRKLQQLPDSKPTPNTSPKSSTDTSDEAIYHGPLAPTIKRLKQFSLTSLSLSFIMSPFIFIIESNLPGFARAALAATAIGTSGISTALVSWAARPYVTTLRRLDPSVDGVKGLEMTTLTWTLQPRITRVYDLEFLVETNRPLAKWELAKEVILPTSPKDGSTLPTVGQEETVAETLDKNGKVLGSWVVKWNENGEGDCREIGTVVRHFNVHPELLR
ncbi:hypothetical protein VKT23_000535 [Stygiomarasmius scandens]|uniref:Uncharacterized protein n=1 Tax=Marasmiellus scandens TaxID=2682957 RepID=A0ABR1K4D9_9AGAR